MNFDIKKPITHVEARNGNLARVGDYVYVSDSLFIALVDRIYFQRSGKKGENDSDGVWMFTGKWVYRMQDFSPEDLRKLLSNRETSEREVFLSTDVCINSVARIVGTCVVRPSIGGPQRGRAWPNHFYYRGLIKKDGTYVDILPENKELLKSVFGPNVDYAAIFKRSSYPKRFLKNIVKKNEDEVKESSDEEENDEEIDENEEEDNEENNDNDEDNENNVDDDNNEDNEEGEEENNNDSDENNNDGKEENDESDNKENTVGESPKEEEEMESERIIEDFTIGVDAKDIKAYIIGQDEVMQVNEDSDDDPNENNGQVVIPTPSNQKQNDMEIEKEEEEEEETNKKSKPSDAPTRVLTRSQTKTLAPPKKKAKTESDGHKNSTTSTTVITSESTEIIEQSAAETPKKEEPKKSSSKRSRKRKETPDEREKRSAHSREMSEKRKLIEFRWIGYGREYSPTLTSYPSGFARYSTIYRNGEYVFFTDSKAGGGSGDDKGAAPRNIGRIALLYDVNETESHMARIELYISRVEQLPPSMRGHKYESLFAKGELFPTTTVLDVPISQILTKCRVAQIAEVGNVVTWSSKQDHFWWCRWYDDEKEELSESIPPRNKNSL